MEFPKTMSIFIPIHDKKGKLFYLSVDKVRYVELEGDNKTVIYCYTNSQMRIQTEMPVETIVHHIHQNSPTKRLIPYKRKWGNPGYISVDYIGHIEADKNGIAEIHCFYKDVRDIFTLENPIQEILGHIQAVGGVIVGG
jgi:hypothetical protein